MIDFHFTAIARRLPVHEHHLARFFVLAQVFGTPLVKEPSIRSFGKNGIVY
jgi:hypothetical protein